MSTHDAEYFRQRRGKHGVPPRHPFSAERSLPRGVELRLLERLPWPRNPSGEHATITELLTGAGQLSGQSAEIPDEVCPCGCRRGHMQNVSQTMRNPYGRGFAVIYFCSKACKSSGTED
jgi:hypothetical protein